MQKCSFRQTSLRFLDHVISEEGILPDTDHITAIRDAPAPNDLVALQSFLGLISWYDKFLPNFATVMEPMRALLRESTDSGLQWTVDADRSFHKLLPVAIRQSSARIIWSFSPYFCDYIRIRLRPGWRADPNTPRQDWMQSHCCRKKIFYSGKRGSGMHVGCRKGEVVSLGTAVFLSL